VNRFKLVGRFSVDNVLISMRLNGIDAGISWTPIPCLSPDDDACMSGWCEFEITDGFSLGENVLVVKTGNRQGYCVAPFVAGFRCELTCALKECQWESDGDAWVLIEGSCPTDYECSEPAEYPGEAGVRIWTTCREVEY
jgi:hypothetical protein